MLKQYAKIVNGELEYAPINTFIDGKLVCNVNRRPDILSQLGYKPLTVEGAPGWWEEDGEPRQVVTDRGEDILVKYISEEGGN